MAPNDDLNKSAGSRTDPEVSRLKAGRKTHRSAITKASNVIEVQLSQETPDLAVLKKEVRKLEKAIVETEALDKLVLEAMTKAGFTEEQCDSETEAAMEIWSAAEELKEKYVEFQSGTSHSSNAVKVQHQPQADAVDDEALAKKKLRQLSVQRGAMEEGVEIALGEAIKLQQSTPDEFEANNLIDELEDMKSHFTEASNAILNILLDLGETQDRVLEEQVLLKTTVKKIKFAQHQLRALLPKPCPRSPTASLSAHSNTDNFENGCRLPKIKLIEFYGDPMEWLSWWEQYNTLVHSNPKLTDRHRFSYLINGMKVTSEPYDLVKSYPATADNYSLAIKALKKKYGNENNLLQIYLRQILRLVISNTSASSRMPLSQMSIKLRSYLNSLKTLKLSAAEPETWLFPLVESALPEDVLREWHKNPDSRESQTEAAAENKNADEVKKVSVLDKLLDFVDLQIESEEKIKLAQSGFEFSGKRPSTSSGHSKHHDNKRYRKEEPKHIATAAGLFNARSESCLFCGGAHYSVKCEKAKDMSLHQKKEKLKGKGCFNCLRAFEKGHQCFPGLKCWHCQGKHVALMCPQKKAQDKKEEPAVKTTNQTLATDAQSERSDGTVFLKTVQVLVKHKGRQVQARLLFDEGSQRSYTTERSAAAVESQPIRTEMVRSILFDGSTTGAEKTGIHKLTLSSEDGKVNRSVKLRVREKLGGALPKLPNGPWMAKLKEVGIFLNDDTKSSGPSEIDVVIGQDYRDEFVTSNRKDIGWGLSAFETVFGWCVGGELQHESVGNFNLHLYMAQDVSQLWELDALGIKDQSQVKDNVEKEKVAMEFFTETVTREADGRYTVSLPWISEGKEIPTNRNIAEKRLVSTTKKLQEKGKFQDYGNIFEDWLNEGIVEEVIEEARGSGCHYLPHHPVFKPESATTPVRPVFDASCKSMRSPSLNDCLYTGPNMIELLPAVIHRFRENSIGVVSDIRKAFQMIGVKPEDRNFLRFLWWKDEKKEKIKVFRHSRVVFGVSASPFLLGAVLDHHLKSYKGDHEKTALKLLKSMYVDNSITSVRDFGEYHKFKVESTQILDEAAMELREWEVTMESDRENGKRFTSVLGLTWDKLDDTLAIGLKKEELPGKLTKRTILSAIASVFDPMGFVSPCLIYPKLILQDLWKLKLGWDKELPTEYADKFREWHQEVGLLKQVRIPRFMSGHQKPDSSTFHLFTDASNVAYAAEILLRTVKDGRATVSLIMSKARVTPVNKMTMPRLELMGALIGARLINSLREALGRDIIVFPWCDSTTALSWIKKNDDWGTFVGNRVREIIKYTNAEDWRYVPTHLNPADLPSRGCTPSQLLQSTWVTGPEWLYRPPSEWPSTPFEVDEDAVNQEKKKVSQMSCITLKHIDWERFGFRKWARIFTYVRRFLLKKLSPDEVKPNTRDRINIGELRQGEIVMIRLIQNEWYQGKDAENLVVTRKQGVLRVKTRLQFKEDLEQFKFPILLPRKHPLILSLVQEIHRFYFHAGVQSLRCKLREKYWIPRVRTVIHAVVKDCKICRRYTAPPLTVPAAPLPEKRVTTGEVFTTVGVDLAGPIYVKQGNQSAKNYAVIFTCAVYRAVHFEVVDSLSAEDFIMALQRFINQMGTSNTVYSDNGSNFSATASLLKLLDWKKVQEVSDAHQIQWTFNPPSAPWYGGWWERLIRFMKELLRKNIGQRMLTQVQLRTVLSSVAATMNDRPLTVVSEEPDEFFTLRPSTFLRPLKSTGPANITNVTDDHLKETFKHMRRTQEELNSRFRKEYLALLVQKGRELTHLQAKVGDVVLIGSEDKKRFQWPLGIIVELNPGRDGEIRVAKLRTKNGFLERPLQRLYPLEMNMDPSTAKAMVQKCKTKSTASPKEDPIIEQEIETPIITKRGRQVKKPNRFGQWNQ